MLIWRGCYSENLVWKIKIIELAKTRHWLASRQRLVSLSFTWVVLLSWVKFQRWPTPPLQSCLSKNGVRILGIAQYMRVTETPTSPRSYCWHKRHGIRSEHEDIAGTRSDWNAKSKRTVTTGKWKPKRAIRGDEGTCLRSNFQSQGRDVCGVNRPMSSFYADNKIEI
jgi:hypothetical protein